MDSITENNEILRNTSLFAEIMEDAIEKYPQSIFVCGLANSKKVKIEEKIITKLFKKDPKILQKYPHLFDNDKNIRLYRHSIGYLFPVEGTDSAFELIKMLINGRKELDRIDQICIKLSTKSPFTFTTDEKVQFRNISCDIKSKQEAIKIFKFFGDIRDCYELQGVWEVLYKSLDMALPILFKEHSKENTSRWFKIHPQSNAEAAFTSKKTCPQCKIKGHDKPTCPGKPLLIQLGIYKDPKINIQKRDQKKGEKDDEEDGDWLPGRNNYKKPKPKNNKGRGRGRGRGS